MTSITETSTQKIIHTSHFKEKNQNAGIIEHYDTCVATLKRLKKKKKTEIRIYAELEPPQNEKKKITSFIFKTISEKIFQPLLQKWRGNFIYVLSRNKFNNKRRSFNYDETS